MTKTLSIVFATAVLCSPIVLSAESTNGEIVNLPGYAFKASTETSASKSTLWRLWTNVENWKAFDTALEYSYLEDGSTFSEGAKGSLKAEGAPGVDFEILDLTNRQSFVLKLGIPLNQTIEQRRYFEPDNNGNTVFTHEVRFGGGLSPLVYLFLQRIYKRETQLVVQQLKLLAENQEEN